MNDEREYKRPLGSGRKILAMPSARPARARSIRGRSLPLDTTADANEFQLRVYQRMGGAARVAAAFRLSAFVRETAVAGIRYRHPEYTDQQAPFAWQRLSLGDSLFREAFPEHPRLEP
jgi:hypothetical protein